MSLDESCIISPLIPGKVQMSETIGQQLKKARENRNFTLKEVTAKLHIRETYLQAMEDDQLEKHLPSVQAKGFIRLYADFLEIFLFEQPEKQSGAPLEPEIKSKQEPTTHDAIPHHETQAENIPVEEPSSENPFGSLFADARKEKALTIADVEQELHIGQIYLQAIEEQDLKALPQGIQARGMIQRYADFLGLDSDEILNQYTDLLLGNQIISLTDKQKRKQVRKIDGTRQFLTPDLLVGVAILILLFTIAFFSIRKVINTRSVMVTTEPAVQSGFTTSTPELEFEALPTDAAMQGTPIPGEIATATLQIRPTGENEENTNSRVRLQIIANQRAYLQIIADGEIVFDGRVKGGNIYEFFGDETIELMTGNAAALDITVIQDGQETRLGILGLVGQVVNLTFQPDIIITPTVAPSLTPTITNTPLPSATPTITSSPTSPEDT
jgi:cytoskeletal protein RodZ